MKDYISLLGWPQEHSLLSYTAHDALVSVSKGVLADKRVNVDKAYSIGIDLAAAMTGSSYTDVKLKRTDRIKSISAANENISVRGHNVEVT